MLLILAMVISTLSARAEPPADAVDRVWNAFVAGNAKPTPEFPAEFKKLSEEVAQDQGTAVIAPIMARSKDWKGEEVLVFDNLVIALPREQVIPILEQYKKTGKPSEKQCAADLLIEIQNYDEQIHRKPQPKPKPGALED